MIKTGNVAGVRELLISLDTQLLASKTFGVPLRVFEQPPKKKELQSR